MLNPKGGLRSLVTNSIINEDCSNIFFSIADALSNLGGQSGKNKLTTLKPALEACSLYLGEISKCMLDLHSAVSLVTLISIILTLKEDPEDKLDVNLGQFL